MRRASTQRARRPRGANACGAMAQRCQRAKIGAPKRARDQWLRVRHAPAEQDACGAGCTTALFKVPRPRQAATKQLGTERQPLRHVEQHDRRQQRRCRARAAARSVALPLGCRDEGARSAPETHDAARPQENGAASMTSSGRLAALAWRRRGSEGQAARAKAVEARRLSTARRRGGGIRRRAPRHAGETG